MRSGRVIWIGLGALAVVVAACDARLEVIKTGERIGADPGGGGSGGAASGGGASRGAGVGADCGTAGGGGARTGDAREVRDMSGDEATAWCNTYIFQDWMSVTDVTVPPVEQSFGFTFPGYVDDYTTSYCWNLASPACVLRTTVSDCVENLRHAPCEATIVELTDCAETMLNAAPRCGVVGQGCDAFMRAPHCSDTVVARPGPPVLDGAGGGMECYLRVTKGCD